MLKHDTEELEKVVDDVMSLTSVQTALKDLAEIFNKVIHKAAPRMSTDTFDDAVAIREAIYGHVQEIESLKEDIRIQIK